VGISPVIEALKETISEKPAGLPELVSDLKKTQAEVATHMEKVMKSAEEFVSFGQGNVEAVIKASQLLATGLQDLSKHFAATVQASVDEATANMKALTSVKTPKEALDLQSAFAKTAIEKTLAETGKITDASMKLAEQVAEPITARVTLAVEKFGKAA
jgi:phasin family protein